MFCQQTGHINCGSWTESELRLTALKVTEGKKGEGSSEPGCSKPGVNFDPVLFTLTRHSDPRRLSCVFFKEQKKWVSSWHMCLKNTNNNSLFLLNWILGKEVLIFIIMEDYDQLLCHENAKPLHKNYTASSVLPVSRTGFCADFINTEPMMALLSSYTFIK